MAINTELFLSATALQTMHDLTGFSFGFSYCYYVKGEQILRGPNVT